MTSPGPECTTGAFEKHRVWPKGDMFESWREPAGQREPAKKLVKGGQK